MVKDTKFHTKNIDNFWSQLKRVYVGIYHYMSSKHCDEFATRYNQYGVSNIERFLYISKTTETNRITYDK